MKKHWLYLKYVVRHKWFVFVECCRLGIPWRGLVHDLSKFRISEWFAYVNQFYGEWGYRYSQERDGGCGDELARQAETFAAFDKAWLLHQHRNPHHWQAWLLREDSPPATYRLTSFRDFGPFMLSWADNENAATFDQFQKDVNGDASYRRAKGIVDALNTSQIKTVPMPTKYAKEMVADWIGAGLAITGKRDVVGWYEKNRKNIELHPDTQALVDGYCRKEN